MNQVELQQVVEEVSLQYFAKPFVHKAIFNPRLKTTGGRYLLLSHAIELNPAYYERFGKEDLIDVVKHELCHYHLHLTGRGYRHRDRDFRVLLKAVNAPRFCKVIGGREKRVSTHLYRYQCKDCFQMYDRKRRMDIAKYVCGKCRGQLKVVNEDRKEIDSAKEM